ncbi:MAG: hypothetical protein HY360_18535 [Verrucomicrobia bacterium]|nr:hypothetical protein [Verrucomicrobiota bacterium]
MAALRAVIADLVRWTIFMKTLSTQDQDDAKIKSLLKDVDRRAKLLETAERRPSPFLQLLTCFLAAICLYLYSDIIDQQRFALFFIVILLAGLIETHTRINNQRIDALIKLLGDEKLSSSKSDHC